MSDALTEENNAMTNPKYSYIAMEQSEIDRLNALYGRAYRTPRQKLRDVIVATACLAGGVGFLVGVIVGGW